MGTLYSKNAPDYLQSIAEGLIENVPLYHTIIGYNPVIDTSLTDINELGVASIPVPATAITVEVVSTLAADTDQTGANVWSVDLHGLDANWNKQVQTVLLAGVTPVAVPGTWVRFNAFHVRTNAGYGVTAAGDISVKATGAGTEYIRISAGGNQSLQTHYTIPDGFNGFVPVWSAGSSGKQPLKILLRATTDWDDRELIPGVFTFQGIIATSNTEVVNERKIPLRFPAKCDIKVSAQSLTESGGEGSGEFQIYLKKHV